MKHNKEVKISYWAAHLTTVVSVTLVLLIIGIIALISVVASTETRRLREKLEVSVVMADSVSNAGADKLAAVIKEKSFAHDVKVISKEEALKNWEADTGENLETLFGVNPLSPEVTFSVTAEYGSENALKKIESELSPLPGVENVVLPDSSMVESMNRNIEKFTVILGVIALVMIIISFVLINNTVHLAIYARRFTIHTMQLVGATNGFIRAPYIGNNMLSGLFSGLIAAGLLGIALAFAPQAGFAEASEFVSWSLYGIIAGALILLGILLCGIAAFMATTRYLRKDYDGLFRS
ncbi:MAG: permease-like cell division protein FtsX [Muribaculaceae bacterium]|nr:permease-like cell division protein FtsX [Muribaculaceae bacterium]